MLGKATEFRKGNLKTKLQFGNTYSHHDQLQRSKRKKQHGKANRRGRFCLMET